MLRVLFSLVLLFPTLTIANDLPSASRKPYEDYKDIIKNFPSDSEVTTPMSAKGAFSDLKHSGDLPIIGVNQFIDPKTLGDDYVPEKIELARASLDEKNQQLDNRISYQNDNKENAEKELKALKDAALSGGNIFEALMNAARVCSLHQMTQALFEVGGQYRRNL